MNGSVRSIRQGQKGKSFSPLYSKRFNTVEVDYTYYSMPKAKHLQKMAEDGPGLSFAITAHQSLTHKIDGAKWKEEKKKYREAIEPVREKGRLEAVLLQFPFSFHYEEENRRYLGKLLDVFSDIQAAVEFRNSEWHNSRVIDGLTKRGVPLVSLDLPELSNLPPTIDVVTSKLAYFRLHGRNNETWWGSDSTARYDYLYTDSELETAKERIKHITVKADRIIIYFNNHARGQAVKNAETLIKILERAGLLKQGEGKDLKNGEQSDSPS
jgi:uncharacterized protein YecE (DUF72 family)